MLDSLSPTVGCSSTFSVGTDMRVRLVETPVRSQGNTTNCEIWIWNKDEIFVLPVLFINIKCEYVNWHTFY